MTLRVFLVRHGETEWNKARLFQGHTDIPLAPSGVQQAQMTGNFIRSQRPQQVYVSPLVRTQQTAGQFKLSAAPTISDQLIEQNLGIWEGRGLAEVASEDPELFRRWRYEGYTPEGAETQEQVQQRMLQALEGVIGDLRETEPAVSSETQTPLRTAVVVSHGAALRLLLEKLEIIYRSHMVALFPASVSCLDIDDDASTAAEISASAQLRLLNLSPGFLQDFAAVTSYDAGFGLRG